MKKVIYLFITLIIITADFSFTQRNGKEKLPREKIEALEKIKLIETLDMDEETTIKFFSRRNEHQEKMKNFFDELDKKRGIIKDRISSAKNDNDPELKKIVDDYFLFQEKLDDEKKRFITSLTDILSYKQIAELTLFERRFREEIREILFHHKKKKRN